MKPDVFPSVPGKKIAKAKIKSKTEEKEKIKGDKQPLGSSELEVNNQSKRIRVLAQAWIRDLYTQETSKYDQQFFYAVTSNEANNELLDKIEATAASDSDDDKVIAIKLGAKIVFDELLDFITTHQKQDKVGIRRLIIRAGRILFFDPEIRMEDRLTNFLDAPERIVLLAKICRIPEAQGFLGYHMMGDILDVIKHYDFSQKDEKKIVDTIRATSLGERLDFIEQLRSIGIIVANQDDEYTRKSVHVVERILDSILRDDQSPLVRYAGEAAVQKVKYESHNRTNSVFLYHDDYEGDPESARALEPLTGVLLEEVLYLGQSFDLGVDVVDTEEKAIAWRNSGNRLFQVSSDAIVVADHNNMPNSICMVSPSILARARARDFVSEPKVTVVPKAYDEVEQDSYLNPFPKKEQPYTSLLLRHLHSPVIREAIEKDLNISLKNIPLRSQIYFLQFLSGKDKQGFNRLSGVIKKHTDISNQILNSFLACAEDVGYSESILTIAENFDTDTAQAVYDKYLEISSASEQIRDFIYHQTNITGITDNQIQKITQKLLHRANEILKSFAQKSSPAEDTPAERERVLKDLETIKDEAWLITSTFSTLRDSGVAVEFKDIVNMNPEIVTGLELARNRKDVDKMLEIFYDNYHKYPAEFRDSIIDGFRQKLAFDSTDFYILRYKGEIVSFFRFDRRFETDGMFKDFYFGSVNTDTGFTGGRFAEVMFSEALKARAKEGVIEADCDPETEVSSKYIEQGFVATKYYVYKSVPSLGLILDQELNSRLRAKNLSQAEIESLENSPELFVVKYNRGEKVDFSKLSQGYVLSRYIKTKEDILCVFEKI